MRYHPETVLMLYRQRAAELEDDARRRAGIDPPPGGRRRPVRKRLRIGSR